MTRRNIVKQELTKVKVSEILNNKDIVTNNNLGILILEDVICDDVNDIAKVVKFILDKKPNNIYLDNCSKDLYLYLIRLSRNNNINISVKFNEELYSVREIYSFLDSSSELAIDEEMVIDNIFDINLEDLSKVKILTQRISTGTVLMLKEIVSGLDYIAKQVSFYAENDLQKILLVDKMLRENTDYDREYYSDYQYYNSLGFHKAHKLETIFTDRLVVCNVYSLFADWLFRHPLLKSVKVKEVSGFWGSEEHAWNEINLNGLWYTHDFTHNVCFDKSNGIKYTLKQKTWTLLTKRDDSGFDYLNTMPEEIIKREYEKIKDIHIKFPTIEQIKFGNFDLCTRRSLNPLGTRRRVIPITANKTFNNEQIITRRRVPKRRKAIVGNK